MRAGLRAIIIILFCAFILSVYFIVYKTVTMETTVSHSLHLDIRHIHEELGSEFKKIILLGVANGVIGLLIIAGLLYRSRILDKLKTQDFLEQEFLQDAEEMKDEEAISEMVDPKEEIRTKRMEELDKMRAWDLHNIEVKKFANKAISTLCEHFQAGQGAFYTTVRDEKDSFLELKGGYAYFKPENGHTRILFGEGLAGQVAKAQHFVHLDRVPPGYIEIISGLGQGTPAEVVILPLVENGETLGVAEIASFEKFEPEDLDLIRQFGGLISSQLAFLVSQTRKDSDN